MKLASRLVLAFALVALFASGITAALVWQAQQQRVHRFLDRDLPRVIEGEPHPPGKPPRFFEQQQRLLRELREANLRAALIALVVALGVGGWLAWRMTRPVSELTRATRRYAEGDRDARARVRGRDELAELARAFNELAERLQSEEELDRRRVADIAHELRTPLQVLKGELEALADGMLDPDPETLERLVEEVDHLALLVGDLRLLSLAESGGLALEPVPYDLAELLARSAEAFSASAEARGVALELDLASAPARIDPARMRQVVFNLIDNALRHARTRVRLGCRLEDGRACLWVADDGPGIPEADLPRVFDRFYRADPARSRRSGGSGLGLAIVRAISEAHGGEATVENREGGGAVFRVCVPAAEAG
ncbi:ATP-binding protein [Oceanithermus sp.]|uniref:sensor histidine kinase n=1 Tax=Oceanithermus sp. TaxID=2268145 RepID=UPI00257D3F40|nr:ATP-binding protein [Oceanithermus sp.]